VQALCTALPPGARDSGGVRWASWLGRAVEMAQDDQEPEPDRVRAVGLLGLMSGREAGETLVRLLDPKQPQAVQLAAIGGLNRVADLEVGSILTRRWGGFTPRVREEALIVMLARPERALDFLRAVESGLVPPGDLDATRADLLRQSPHPTVREMAGRVLMPRANVERVEVFRAYEPALSLAGDVTRGRFVFLERCASCHRHEGQGYAVGPDMETVRHVGRESLLLSILDPGAGVSPQYVAYEVETTDGESYVGMLVEETATSVTVRQAYGQERVLLRKQILSLRASDRSMMPEELELGLDPQGMADLLEYILAVD
jgi:putative heme-binding domain-containing protein